MIAALLLAAAFAVPPVPMQYVTDNAGALRAETIASLDRELRSYHDASGNRIIVYVDRTTGGIPLEDWTVAAAHAWKIGAKGKDNGAILFVFMRDRKVRIEVGYGLEGSLTDAAAQRIIQESVVPKMRAGDVDGAVRAGAEQMILTVTPSFKVSGATDEGGTALPSSPGGLASDRWIEFTVLFFIFGTWAAVLLAGILRKNKGAVAFAGGGASSFGGSSSDDDSFSDSGGDDFSGGGDFGGGGASGSW